MQIVGNYNKISKELEEAIPEMSDVVTFQLLNGTPNPEPDAQERAKIPVLYGKTQLRTQFRVRDPFSKKNVDIVLAEDWDDDKPKKAICFVAGSGETHFNGVFALMADNAEHRDLYEVLWLSPEREGSPCVDSSIPKRFKIVSKKEESAKTNAQMENLLKALNFAKDMKEDEGRELAASMNWDSYKDEWKDLHPVIKNYAKSNVDTFLIQVESPETQTKATLKKALDAGILSIDLSTMAVSLDKTLLCTIEKNYTKNPIDGLATWIANAANGEKVLSGINKQLKSAK